MRATALRDTIFEPQTVTPPSHEEIAARAYLLYLERPAGDRGAIEDWIQAERELRDERTARQAPPKRLGAVRRAVDHDLAHK